MNKAHGRLHKPKEAAKKIIKGKKFKCPKCEKIMEIKNVEFGAKYVCSKCGYVGLHEMLR